VEFGLIREKGDLRIYGAGILSSAGETKHSISREARQVAYDVDVIMSTAYRKDEFQKQYFVIEQYEDLYQSLGQIEAYLRKHADHPEPDFVLS
jgi:phenylalanine-4-hydroxylase